MALTPEVKAELAAVPVTKPACRKAEVAALLRFAGSLHIAGGKIMVEVDLDTGAAARRLCRSCARAGTSNELSVTRCLFSRLPHPSALYPERRPQIPYRTNADHLQQYCGQVGRSAFVLAHQ